MTTRQAAYRARQEQSGARSVHYLLDADTLATLDALRQRWACSEVEAVRRSLRFSAVHAPSLVDTPG